MQWCSSVAQVHGRSFTLTFGGAELQRLFPRFEKTVAQTLCHDIGQMLPLEFYKELASPPLARPSTPPSTKAAMVF